MRLWRSIWEIVAVVSIMTIMFSTMAFSAEAVISGTIEKDIEGIVLARADGERYVVLGKDLTDLVGKTVQVTGSVEEGPYGKSIWVSSIQILKER